MGCLWVGYLECHQKKCGFKYSIPATHLPCQHVSSDRTSRSEKMNSQK